MATVVTTVITTRAIGTQIGIDRNTFLIRLRFGILFFGALLIEF